MLVRQAAGADVVSGTGRKAEVAVSPAAGDIAIYICRDPVDFRMGINGLGVMVEATLKFDPFSRNLFCFVNKRKNQIKVLYWQRTGFCLEVGVGSRIDVFTDVDVKVRNDVPIVVRAGGGG